MMLDPRDIIQGVPDGDHEVVVLSMPEVASLSLRAAHGAGLPWGLAEECGYAAVCLAEQRLDWAPVLLRRLEGRRGARPHPQAGAWRSSGPSCALVVGVTLSDFAELDGGLATADVALGPVLDPVLVLPFVSRVAATQTKAFNVRLAGRPWANVDAKGAIKVIQTPTTTTQGLVSVHHSADPEDAPDPGETAQSAPVRRPVYAQLDALALRMTVPASSASAMRAGGEGSDNE